MSIKRIAKRIPDEVRSQFILSEDDPIYNAVAVKDNEPMKLLLKIWKEFVEPHKEISDCSICINNILTNYRQMKDILIELENDYQFLKQL
jgi:hypothetical protein